MEVAGSSAANPSQTKPASQKTSPEGTLSQLPLEKSGGKRKAPLEKLEEREELEHKLRVKICKLNVRNLGWISETIISGVAASRVVKNQ